MGSLKNKTEAFRQIAGSFWNHYRPSRNCLRSLPYIVRGYEYGRAWSPAPGTALEPSYGAIAPVNPLKAYFDSHNEGRGIWKWEHYFEIYHRHFSRFVGRDVRVLEIGVYSGGSLEMWHEYFGPHCEVFGVDIDGACKAYQDDSTTIFIGDQRDRGFWRRFKQEVPAVDILIDDGGHTPEQQIVTLEEMLPHLRPGGIYCCEDIHEERNPFHYYVLGLATSLNASRWEPAPGEKGLACSTAPFQAAIRSINLYPFVTVIEKNEAPVEKFAAPKQGSEWQPF